MSYGGSLEEGDGKAFWNYVKLQRTESLGIQLKYCKRFLLSLIKVKPSLEWKMAIVSQLKDDKSSQKTYRPISLTCISCKIIEHVLCSHLSNNLELNNILTSHQHDLREGFST